MPHRIEIYETDTGGALSYAFKALCDRVACGDIRVVKHPRPIAGKAAWVVRNVHVPEGFRRQGIATKLYEAAAQAACRRRGRLVSAARNPGAHSNDFWSKQDARGRVLVIKPKGGGPPLYMLPECPVGSLAAVRPRKRSPKRRG